MLTEKDIGNNTLDAVIMIPVYNDWESIRQLIQLIDLELSDKDYRCGMLLINDCSTIEPDENTFAGDIKYLGEIRILNLKRNLGHQRAIAIGLSYIEANMETDAVLIMDGDGEDSPSHIQQLVKRLREEGEKKVVFAERLQRSGTVTFKTFYYAYHSLHRLLIGKSAKVGNFCIIPAILLQRIVASSELWNHFSATILKNRIPHVRVPLPRSNRIAGQSKMNFASLVVHGISSYAVHADIVGVRVLIGSAIMAALSFVAIALIVGIRLFAQMPIPGWAAILIAILLLFSVQAIQLAGIMTLFILTNRSSSSFVPSRDYVDFISNLEVVREG